MAELPEDARAAWVGFVTTHTLLFDELETALAAAGLPPIAWFDVLAPLQHHTGGLRMGQLAEEVITIGRTGLTRLVDRMVSAGLVERAHAEDDRRAVEVTITAAGQRTLRKMWPIYERVITDRFVAPLTSRELDAMRTGFERIAGAGDGTTAPAPLAPRHRR